MVFILFNFINFIKEILFHFLIIKLLVNILQTGVVLHSHQFIAWTTSVSDNYSGL